MATIGDPLMISGLARYWVDEDDPEDEQLGFGPDGAARNSVLARAVEL